MGAASDVRSARRWRRSLRRALASTPRALRGIDPASPIVVVCQWRRAEVVDRLLADLAAQRDVRCTLVLWCNNPLALPALLRATRRAASGALRDIRIVPSRTNLGGLARFVVAHRLLVDGHTAPVVMIDDDMRLAPDVVRRLIDASGPRTYAGHWAWDPVADDYHERRMADDGADAAYVGTGGAVVDPSLADTDFFELLPDRFAAVEDLWASIVAHHRGWHVRRVELDVEYVDDGRDQYRALPTRKAELWRDRATLMAATTAAHDGDVGLEAIGLRESAGWVGSVLRRAAARLLGRA